MEKFLENFAAQFEDTDAAVFKPETVFKELEEWSSLLSMSIIAMIDEDYGVIIKGEEIRNAKTIQDLFEIVKVKKM